MKSDVVFGLENAAWPALFVDGAGAICRANATAIETFGPALEAESARLGAIWSPENALTPERFLLQCEQLAVTTISLKLRGKAGNTVCFQTSLCSCSMDGLKYFMLQFFPESAPEAKPAAPGGDTMMMHNQKLDCALQLARTVALDFNNALTSILGHTSFILRGIQPDHPWRASLLEVEKSAARAAEIAGDLGAFSRQEKESRAQASGNLNQLAQRCVSFSQGGPEPKTVAWTLQFERKLFTAKFDETKMQQAILKILENAVESMSADGRITVQTRNLELKEPTQDRNVYLAAGAYVCLEISDNGCGIESDVLPRVFEPFFTTKGSPHRGLGLAWVYGIVTNHGGGVAISSQSGSGTSVRVYLPASTNTVREHSLPGDDLSGGGKTVLMVDDEDLLLTMGQTILSAHGYRVLTANSGQKALDILGQEDAAVDLVITDLVMPAMSGRELVEHIHRLEPAMRVLCTSGYVWPADHENGGAYLQKPFTTEELLVKVKQMLAG
jgi:nitrogen-specific signal transduction histidine kinase/CheY-like chemotaxis protein